MSKLRSDYHYILPKELIAQHPAERRDGSRLLVLSDGIEHRKFPEFVDMLDPGDLLVMNDTRVIPARLFARKDSGGKVEILIERIASENVAICQVRASKAIKPGRRLTIDDSSVELTVGPRVGSLFSLHFPVPVMDVLGVHGRVPLPPYIDRQLTEDNDTKRYQTVFACQTGAVAAPTAGLHFDEALLEKIQRSGVGLAYVTLHVGAGTFSPVRVDNIDQHQMHYERYSVQADTINAIRAVRKNGGRIIAVGTTVVRTLETLALKGWFEPDREQGLEAPEGETNIFISPGFEFQVVDALLTNFHVPESSLIMLVSAFVGRQRVLNAYAEAVNARYRFFSYGDAMFIPRSLPDV
ncbi:MAG: tRNA preQ1(34) S-adenosylmethionine ribosyltransferase-isomerase QueA [Pseudomonadales bacterium]|nr:tRNA preQ1(34) S-adenosylmethionine ribosyltransferase-isomerase QueA [Pseudomonadales bacterium]